MLVCSFGNHAQPCLCLVCRPRAMHPCPIPSAFVLQDPFSFGAYSYVPLGSTIALPSHHFEPNNL